MTTRLPHSPSPVFQVAGFEHGGNALWDFYGSIGIASFDQGASGAVGVEVGKQLKVRCPT